MCAVTYFLQSRNPIIYNHNYIKLRLQPLLTLRGGVCDMEALVSDNKVRVEMDPGSRARGLERWWRSTATVSIQKCVIREQPISNLMHKQSISRWIYFKQKYALKTKML